MRLRLAPESSPEKLTEIAKTCELGAKLLEQREAILKQMTSGKRKPRNVPAALLWKHISKKIGKHRAGSMLASLIACADEAFEKPLEWQGWETFDLAAKRYREIVPNDFETRIGEGRRSRQALPAESAKMWRRLNKTDCRNIVDSLRPHFERELNRLGKSS